MAPFFSLNVWSDLSVASFLLAGVSYDFVCVKLFLALAYVFLLLGYLCQTGLPGNWIWTTGTWTMIPWDIICFDGWILVVHIIGSYTVLADEFAVAPFSAEGEKLWNLMFRRAGIERFSMKKLLTIAEFRTVMKGEAILTETEVSENVAIILSGSVFDGHSVRLSGDLIGHSNLTRLGVTNFAAPFIMNPFNVQSEECRIVVIPLAKINQSRSWGPGIHAAVTNYIMYDVGQLLARLTNPTSPNQFIQDKKTRSSTGAYETESWYYGAETIDCIALPDDTPFRKNPWSNGLFNLLKWTFYTQCRWVPPRGARQANPAFTASLAAKDILPIDEKAARLNYPVEAAFEAGAKGYSSDGVITSPSTPYHLNKGSAF